MFNVTHTDFTGTIVDYNTNNRWADNKITNNLKKIARIIIDNINDVILHEWFVRRRFNI